VEIVASETFVEGGAFAAGDREGSSVGDVN